MNNFERIKAMNIDEMVKNNVRGFMEHDADGFDYDFWYTTSDGKFFEDKSKAMAHERAWLLHEAK